MEAKDDERLVQSRDSCVLSTSLISPSCFYDIPEPTKLCIDAVYKQGGCFNGLLVAGK